MPDVTNVTGAVQAAETTMNTILAEDAAEAKMEAAANARDAAAGKLLQRQQAQKAALAEGGRVYPDGRPARRPRSNSSSKSARLS